jgi:hypothetical protein
MRPRDCIYSSLRGHDTHKTLGAEYHVCQLRPNMLPSPVGRTPVHSNNKSRDLAPPAPRYLSYQPEVDTRMSSSDSHLCFIVVLCALMVDTAHQYHKIRKTKKHKS